MNLKLKEQHTDSTGFDWLPIEQHGNHMLLLGDVILRGTPYDKNDWKHKDFREATSFEMLQKWKDENLAPEMKSILTGANFDDYENSKPCKKSDKIVFVLSKPEVFNNMTREECEYCKCLSGCDNCALYWLRSVGFSSTSVSIVNTNGNCLANSASTAHTLAAFRPAIWVNLESEISESGEDENKINKEAFEVPIDFEKMRPIGEVKYSFTPSEISICEVKPEHEYLSGFADGIKFAN